MGEETTVYCGSCGGELSATARFCRACGAPQEEFTAEQPPATLPPAPAPSPPPPAPMAPRPAPPPPVPAPSASAAAWSQSNAVSSSGATGNRVAAYLAILGGLGLCFMVLYAIVYVPLHHHFPFAFGEPLALGDILAFGVGLLAICIGALALKRAPTSPGRSGALLIAAGLLPIVLVAVWALPETLHLDYDFGRPFYFGFVYFCELGKAHIGSGYVNGYVQVPLAVSSALVLLAGCTMALARRQPAVVTSWR
jgi:hypothetical protein